MSSYSHYKKIKSTTPVYTTHSPAPSEYFSQTGFGSTTSGQLMSTSQLWFDARGVNNYMLTFLMWTHTPCKQWLLRRYWQTTKQTSPPCNLADKKVCETNNTTIFYKYNQNIQNQNDLVIQISFEEWYAWNNAKSTSYLQGILAMRALNINLSILNSM